MSQCPICHRGTLTCVIGGLAICSNQAGHNKPAEDNQTDPAAPSPYEQGFRDALLTVKAAVSVARAELEGPNYETRDEGDAIDSGILEKVERALDLHLAKKNHDLYKLLAVAQVDLSHHPEAQALRSMLRAPSGLLIDGAGRVLFVRLNGTEYETGVMGLLEENKSLQRTVDALLGAAPPPPDLITIIVNGLEYRVLRKSQLTYDNIVTLARMADDSLRAIQYPTVTYHGGGELGTFSGTIAGGSIAVAPGMILNVAAARSSGKIPESSAV